MARVISRPDTEVSQVNLKGISCETQAMSIVISDKTGAQRGKYKPATHPAVEATARREGGNVRKHQLRDGDHSLPARDPHAERMRIPQDP